MATLALASAASLAGAAYLNARFGLAADVHLLREERAWAHRLNQRIEALGPKCTLYGIFETVDLNLEALWFEGRSWTYGELKNDAEKLSGVLKDGYGINAGDHVAIFTTNSPEMVIASLAVSKLGAVAAMINTNLRDDTFVHCLDVAMSRAVISTPDLAEFVRSDLPHVSLGLYSFDKVNEKTATLSLTSSEWTTVRPIPETAHRGLTDLCMLIYTSGTSGKPKACAVKNMQILVTSNPLSSDVNNSKKYFPLRTYSPLPLFHGTAFFTGLCYVVGSSGTLCLRRKFSASGFWKDVSESRATRVLYIGELCRYLLASPTSNWDTDHQCLVAHGNGLRKEIWEEFKTRFNVEEIREFYRSTEGLAKFDNHGPGCWGAGMVGFAGPLRRYVEEDTFLIKVNKDTGVPIRDPNTGLCVRAGYEEAGEAVGRVKNRGFMAEYFGNEKATEEKILRGVFREGDEWQRMGDLLVHEPNGWVRFADRVGDTFRWKGENVSAGEVRDYICLVEGVEDAVVYGVRLDRYDGQAGAAAITLKENNVAMRTKFANELHSFLRRKGLPTYATPRLIRFTQSIGSGVTFKQAKGDLVKKSWSPETPDGDAMYWLDGTTYKELDTQSWSRIQEGTAKL